MQRRDEHDAGLACDIKEQTRIINELWSLFDNLVESVELGMSRGLSKRVRGRELTKELTLRSRFVKL